MGRKRDADLADLVRSQSRQIEALSRLVERQTEMFAAGAKVEPLTVLDLLTRYFANRCALDPTWQRYEYKFWPMLEHFGSRDVSAVTVEAWEEYVEVRLSGVIRPGLRIGPTTVNTELGLLRSALRWAVKRKIIAANPLESAERLKAKSKGQAPMREGDLERVLAAAPNLMTQVFIAVGLDSGLRRNENLMLRWPDINAVGRVIHVRNGKGGKARDVVTTARAIDFIGRLPRWTDSVWLYENRTTRRHYSDVRIGTWVREAIQESGIEADYDGLLRVHSLRHGYGTNAIERGVDIRTVQAQMGHASIATTEVYAHSRLEHRKATMREKFEIGIGIKDLPRRGPKKVSPAFPSEIHEKVKINGAGS